MSLRSRSSQVFASLASSAKDMFPIPRKDDISADKARRNTYHDFSTELQGIGSSDFKPVVSHGNKHKSLPRLPKHLPGDTTDPRTPENLFSFSEYSQSLLDLSQLFSNREDPQFQLKSVRARMATVISEKHQEQQEIPNTLEILVPNPKWGKPIEYSIELPITFSMDMHEKDLGHLKYLLYTLIEDLTKKYPFFDGIQIQKNKVCLLNNYIPNDQEDIHTCKLNSDGTYEKDDVSSFSDTIIHQAEIIRAEFNDLFTKVNSLNPICIVTTSYMRSCKENGMKPHHLSSLPCFTNPSNRVRFQSLYPSLHIHRSILNTLSFNA